MKPEKVKTPLLSQPAKSYIHADPLGVCLIIAPFNYPLRYVYRLSLRRLQLVIVVY